MPVHNWEKVDAGLFHSLHQGWIARLTDALNDGPLPDDYFALPEQYAEGPIPDVLALKLSNDEGEWRPDSGGLAVATAPPQTRFEIRKVEEAYVEKANRIAIRHRHGEVVSIIEIVSPGNKNGNRAFKTFVEKTCEFLQAGVHVMIVDLLPPTVRDPHGIHHAVWSHFETVERHCVNLFGRDLGMILTRSPLPPLFEKERHARARALISQAARPVRVHVPSAWAALAAADHPVNVAPFQRSAIVRDVERVVVRLPFAEAIPVRADPAALGNHHRPEQRLAAQEAHARRDRQQRRDALLGPCLVLDRRADPDVRRNDLSADLMGVVRPKVQPSEKITV